MRFEEGISDYTDETFIGLDYTDEIVVDIDFRKCTFKNCSFYQTTFENCSFVDCIFIKSDLSLMKIKSSNWNEILFKDCKVIGVDWSQKYKYKAILTFEHCSINYSVFSMMTLKSFKLTDSKALEADFIECDMTGAVCTGNDFENAHFHQCNLTGAQFQQSMHYYIGYTENKLKNTKFSLPQALNFFTQLGITVTE